MNVIQFRARELREENRERHVEIMSVPVTIRVTEAEVHEAFEDLLRAAEVLAKAQEALNRAHSHYARVAKATGRE